MKILGIFVLLSILNSYGVQMCVNYLDKLETICFINIVAILLLLSIPCKLMGEMNRFEDTYVKIFFFFINLGDWNTFRLSVSLPDYYCPHIYRIWKSNAFSVSPFFFLKMTGLCPCWYHFCPTAVSIRVSSVSEWVWETPLVGRMMFNAKGVC